MSDSITSSAVIHLISGLPRNGKSLMMVQKIREMAKKLKPDQTIYVRGFPDLCIEGTACLLDHKQWHLLPVGSIVVFDEAWELFPRLPNGAARPEYYSAFATLGHRGHIAYFVTQDPGQLDSSIRFLIGTHTHVERLAGAQAASVFYWPKCVDPSSKAVRRTAQVSTWAYPKDCYKLYTSSAEHTVKLEVPKLVKFQLGVVLFGILLAVLGVAYFLTHMDPAGSVDGLEAAEVDKPAQAQQIEPGSPESTPYAQTVAARQEPKPDYFAERAPRIDGLPHTAPVYDALTTPTQAPKPAACILGSGKNATCTCYTQQATRIVGMTQDLCRAIVRDGYFDDSAQSSGPVQANGPVSTRKG